MIKVFDEKIDHLSFEESYAKLNEIVEVLEKGDVSLDDSIKYYEQGIKLKNHCESKLKSAELKIKKVVEHSKIKTPDE